jgi:carbon storage regulator
MLVLSRKEGEAIVIADIVEVIVVEVRGDKVRLGVAAPKEIPVHRKEVYEAIKSQEAELKLKKENEHDGI